MGDQGAGAVTRNISETTPPRGPIGCRVKSAEIQQVRRVASVAHGHPRIIANTDFFPPVGVLLQRAVFQQSF